MKHKAKFTHWRVDPIQSYLLGTTLEGSHLSPIDHPLSLDPVWKIWIEVVFVSICHQTNWDRLHEHIVKIAKETPADLYPTSLCRLDIRHFRDRFGPGIDNDRLQAR